MGRLLGMVLGLVMADCLLRLGCSAGRVTARGVCHPQGGIPLR